MNYRLFVETWNSTRLQNRVLFASCVATSVAVCLLALKVFDLDTVVVLVPPTLSDKATVLREKADKKYVESWALYLAQLIGNVSPENADFIKATLSPLLSTSIYQNVMNILDDQALSIKKDRVTLLYRVHEVVSEPTTGKTFVTGQSVIYGPTGKNEEEIRSYEFKISFRDYRPVILWVNSYPGVPRTEAVLKQLASDEKKE